jgi:hypothetical protein
MLTNGEEHIVKVREPASPLSSPPFAALEGANFSHFGRILQRIFDWEPPRGELPSCRRPFTPNATNGCANFL